MNVVLSISKGGPGSGFHGHAGRPGKVGGSASSGAYDFSHVRVVNSVDELHDDLDGAKVYFISPDNKLIDVINKGLDTHRSVARTIIDANRNKFDPNVGVGSLEALLNAGFIRVHTARELSIINTFISISTRKFDTDTLHRVQQCIDDGSIPYSREYDISWEDATQNITGDIRYLSVSYTNLMTAKYFTNGELKEFTEEKQLPISDAGKEVLIKIRTGIFAEFSDGLSEDVYTGKISIGQWEESMKRAIRELHSSIAAIGKGGWDKMTWADWGRLGPVMKEQYRYLHGFAENIAANKESISIDAIKARARMYGNAGGFSSIMVQAGDVLAKKLPWLPKDGSTECLVNCKCYWDLVVIGEDKNWKTVQATWRLRPAEHCDDCLDRRNHVEIIQVHKSVEVPPTIG